MPLPEACDGQLTIGGVLMHGYAWNILRLISLWMPGDQRGTDRLLPLTPGVIAYQRRLTVTRHSLPMAIAGEVNQAGVPYADVWAGLEANIAALKSTVVAPTGTGDGTRASSLVMPSGATRTADIHVLDLIPGRVVAGTNMMTGMEGVGMVATLEISIPAGEFV